MMEFIRANKKIIIWSGVSVLVVALAIVVIMVFFVNKDKTEDVPQTVNTDPSILVEKANKYQQEKDASESLSEIMDSDMTLEEKGKAAMQSRMSQIDPGWDD